MQPYFAVIRVQWDTAITLTAVLNEKVSELVMKTKQEVRVVGQSHDHDTILYTLQIGR